jgi:hypothetical protein
MAAIERVLVPTNFNTNRDSFRSPVEEADDEGKKKSGSVKETTSTIKAQPVSGDVIAGSCLKGLRSEGMNM